GQAIVRADAAAGADIAALVVTPVPSLLGGPGAAPSGGGKSGGANRGKIGAAGRGIGEGGVVHAVDRPVTGCEGIAVACGREERLALSRHFLENIICGGIRAATPAPRATELLDLVAEIGR